MTTRRGAASRWLGAAIALLLVLFVPVPPAHAADNAEGQQTAPSATISADAAEPRTAQQLSDDNIIAKGELTVDDVFGVSGTIEAPGDRHRYEVELEAGRFYRIRICGCYVHESGFTKRQMQLFDADGTPVSDNGRYVTSSTHRLFGGVRIYYQPTASGTYLLEVRASDGHQTGNYALNADDVTIIASSDDEGPGEANDFGQGWTNRASLALWTPGSDAEISGNLNDDGDRQGILRDFDSFGANLHAGATYEFTFAAASIEDGTKRLGTRITGPGNHFSRHNTEFFTGDSKTQTITFTPDRTGYFVFQIHILADLCPRDAAEDCLRDLSQAGSYTVRLTQQ